MTPACDHCASPLPAGARYCPDCGRQVGAGQSPESAEKRQLTILFCDLVGSTPIASHLDPEDWSRTLQAFHKTCDDTLRPLGAHIAQYLGDGVLAYFGYPTANESDSERGLRAGLAMLEAMHELNRSLPNQPDLQVRVGVHTGSVVLNRFPENEQLDSLAHGDAVNLTFRLTQSTDPGSLITSGMCLRLSEGLFRVSELGMLTLRGFDDPLSAYRVEGAIDLPSRFDAAAGRELTPLIGRRHESGLLLDGWRSAVQGDGNAILVSGEAGIGKSRLIHVLGETLAAEPHSWLACGCWPYEQHSAFHPFLHLLRRTTRWEEHKRLDERIGALVDSLRVSGVDPATALPLLSPLLSFPLPAGFPPVDLTPEERRERTLDTLYRWIRGQAGSRPGVLVVEDLHWADPSSLELLGRILSQLDRERLLVILSARPEFESPWTAPGEARSLAVQHLSPSETTQMVELLAGDQALAGDLRRQLVERTDGIPLFVEELTGMLVDPHLMDPADRRGPGTGAPAIPATLQASLLARIDRLEDAKRLTQIAAVVGREFSRGILGAVSELGERDLERGLRRLVDARLVHAVVSGPEERFRFNHALIRDACYDSLLRAQRRKLHARVADALERVTPKDAETQPEILAHHCTHAGLVTRAVEYLRRSGERAVEAWAGTEATRHFRAAIDLVRSQPESEALLRVHHELQVRLCLVLFMMRGTGDSEVMRALQEGRALATRTRSPTDLSVLTALLAGSHSMRAEYESGRRLSQQGIEQLSENRNWDGWTMPVRSAHSILLATLSSALLFLGRLDEARAACAEARGLHDPANPMEVQVGMTDPSMVAYSNGALIACLLGSPSRALELGEQGVRLVENRPAAYSQSFAFASTFLALTHLERREPERAREIARSVVQTSEERGMGFFLAAGRLIDAAASALTDDPLAAARDIQAAMAAGAEMETRFAGSMWLAYLATALRRGGDAAGAMAHVQLAEAFADQTGEDFYRAELSRLRGELLQEADSSDPAAEAALRDAVAVARRQGAVALEVRAATSLARHLLERGDTRSARDVLADALGRCPEAPDLPDYRDARSLLTTCGG